MEILRAIAIGMVVALSCVGSATAATYGGAKDVQEISGSVGISSGNITIANSTFSVVNSTVGVVQAGAFTISNSTFGARQQGVWNVGLSSGANIIGLLKITDNDGHTADVDTAGRLYVNTSVSSPLFFSHDPGEIFAATAGTDNPLILIVNPIGSGRSIRLQYRAHGITTTNVGMIFRLYENAVITSSGTATSVYAVGMSTTSVSVAKTYKLPTLSSLGFRVDSHAQGQNTSSVQIRDDGQLYLLPGQNWVITADPTSNNRGQATSMKWTEDTYP